MTADDADREPLATLMIPGHPPIEMRGPVTFGRDPRAAVGDTVVIDDDPLVSKSHFTLDVHGDRIVVTDLGSSNGTFVHHATGETAVPSDDWVTVSVGAEIEFGDQRMRIDRVDTRPAAAVDGATPVHGVAAPVPPIAPEDPWGAALAPGPGAAFACHHCRRELTPGARFCDGCGTPTTPAPSPPGPGPMVPGPAGAVPAQAAPPAEPPAGAPAGPEFVDLSDAGRSSGRTAKIIAAVVGGVVVLALLGFVASMLVGGDDGDGANARSLVVPEQVDELWSESVSGEAIGAAVDGRGVYVVAADLGSGEVQATGFDRGNGDELWDVELSIEGSFADTSGVSDGVVLVTVCDAECTLVALDGATGDELWDHAVGDGFPSLIDGRLITIDGGTVESLDPRTGDRIDRVRGDDVTISSGHILVTDGDEVEVFDLDLVSVVEPEDVDQADAVAFDGQRLIVAEGDELRFVAADGTVAKESRVDVGMIDSIRSVDDGNLVLGSEEGVISIDPRDGTADERWSARGELTGASDVDGGPVVLVERAGTVRVLDADSGDERFEFELDQPDGGFTAPGKNLLVIYEFDDFDDPTELTAYDWVTGDRVWDERFDGFPSVRDGLVIELTRDGDVIVYG